uniref:Uncharacterized LOC100177065 n=1 Tax=Ciona intestinalis TaxID=7719 RepID=H2XZ07_CIOIN|nr:uncharacterized protein LOC100177065 [Ciona intestinalis]|eukprot:XP_002130896.1 uncharacterized protein LOC100177065 [Ciona intestinalis]
MEIQGNTQTDVAPDFTRHHAGGDTPASYNSCAETSEVVMNLIQPVMQDLEEKREADRHMLEEYRNRMQNLLDLTCHQIEKRLIHQHEHTNKEIEVKMQYLNEVLVRVVNLECELSNFKNAVASLFDDLNH